MKFFPSKHSAVVTVWQTEGAVEYERKVDDLKALYDACKGAPPSKLASITLVGPDGEVTLKFASFLHRS